MENAYVHRDLNPDIQLFLMFAKIDQANLQIHDYYREFQETNMLVIQLLN